MGRKIGNANSIKLKLESMLSQNKPNLYLFHMCAFGVWIIGQFKKQSQTMGFYLPKQLPSSPLANEMRSFSRRNIPCSIESFIYSLDKWAAECQTNQLFCIKSTGILKLQMNTEFGRELIFCVCHSNICKEKGVISTSFVSFRWTALSTQN